MAALKLSLKGSQQVISGSELFVLICSYFLQLFSAQSQRWCCLGIWSSSRSVTLTKPYCLTTQWHRRLHIFWVWVSQRWPRPFWGHALKWVVTLLPRPRLKNRWSLQWRLFPKLAMSVCSVGWWTASTDRLIVQNGKEHLSSAFLIWLVLKYLRWVGLFGHYNPVRTPSVHSLEVCPLCPACAFF